MQWIDDYSLGIQEIDEQHKKLLEAFSTIGRAIAAKCSWSEIHFRIIKLKILAMRHFEFEEALMRMFAFTEYAEHTDFHEQFLMMLTDIERSFLTGSEDVELVKFLNIWFKDHILVCDNGYAAHIRSGAAMVMTKTRVSAASSHIQPPQAAMP